MEVGKNRILEEKLEKQSREIEKLLKYKPTNSVIL